MGIASHFVITDTTMRRKQVAYECQRGKQIRKTGTFWWNLQIIVFVSRNGTMATCVYSSKILCFPEQSAFCVRITRVYNLF